MVVPQVFLEHVRLRTRKRLSESHSEFDGIITAKLEGAMTPVVFVLVVGPYTEINQVPKSLN